MFSLVTQVSLRLSLYLNRRVRAASVTTANTGWIIIAVALVAAAVALVAVPSSPVHQWMFSSVDSITSISS